jgi:hypothetical protein
MNTSDKEHQLECQLQQKQCAHTKTLTFRWKMLPATFWEHRTLKEVKHCFMKTGKMSTGLQT